MNADWENVAAILAAFIVLLTAIIDPVLAVGIAVLCLVAYGTLSLARRYG